MTGKLIAEFYDLNLVKPGDFFTDFGMTIVSLIAKKLEKRLGSNKNTFITGKRRSIHANRAAS